MLTLSQATSESRTTLKILLIILGGIISIFLAIRIISALKNTFFPTPPAPPTVSFGTLPDIKFPRNASAKKLTYTLNTVSGGLPIFPDREYVNKIEGYTRNIFEVDNANSVAQAIGFGSAGMRLSDEVYRWEESSGIQRQLTMNVVTRDFIMSSQFLSDPTSLSQTTLTSEDLAKQTASDFIAAMNEVPNDLDDSKTSTALYRVDNGALLPASSLSNAQIIGVYFYQADVNDLPIMYPNASTSTMNLLVGSGEDQPQVVAADFSHQNISSESATYPIISASEAYDKLKNGDAYISSYYSGNDIQIQNIYLAYYVGEEKQNYLMPIVVFQGSDGFYAYVSAVRDEWIKR